MRNEESDPMIPNTKRRNLLLHSAFCIVHSAFLLTGGCEALGVALHQAIGEPPVKAQYVPPVASTLILVENYRSPDEMQIDGDQIAHEVSDELKKQTKLEIVDPAKLVPLREDDPGKYRSMNIQTLGKTLGAKQVIYVDLIESDVNRDPTAGAVHAVATARVRVIDTQSGNTLWPADASHGKEITESIDFDPVDGSHAVAMHTEMLAKLSSKISKLFYTWKPDDQYQEDAGG
jgi:hypothetical protein